jgi:hypothetical protein
MSGTAARSSSKSARTFLFELLNKLVLLSNLLRESFFDDPCLERSRSSQSSLLLLFDANKLLNKDDLVGGSCLGPSCLAIYVSDCRNHPPSQRERCFLNC